LRAVALARLFTRLLGEHAELTRIELPAGPHRSRAPPANAGELLQRPEFTSGVEL